MAKENTLRKIKTLWMQIWGLVFFLGVAINFAEIICRYFFGFSWDLMYDLPVWLTIWSVMMIAGPILPDGDHVSVDMFKERLSGNPRKILDIFNVIICIIFGVIISYGGILLVSKYYQFDMNIIRIIPVPRWIVELSIPAGMILFTIFAFVKLVFIIQTNYKKIKIEGDEYTR